MTIRALLQRLLLSLRHRTLPLPGFFLMLSLLSCNLLDPTPGPPAYNGQGGGGGPGTGTATATAGQAIYLAQCARCHGNSAEGTTIALGIQGRAGILNVVRTGKGSMPPFAALTEVEVRSIELFLATFGTGGVDTLMNAALYASQCARCHGPAAEGIVGNGPGLELQRGIVSVTRTGRGDMPAFPNLTDAQIASLETFLAGVRFERTGRNLYVRYCQACHGSDARGTSRGDNIRRELDDIREAVTRGKGNMPAFPELNSADINAIRAYVAGL